MDGETENQRPVEEFWAPIQSKIAGPLPVFARPLAQMISSTTFFSIFNLMIKIQTSQSTSIKQKPSGNNEIF